jgi:nitroreductase
MRICNFIPTKRRNVIIKRWISIVVVPILIQLLINVGGNMGGILFMGTAMPGKIKAFYIDQVGCQPWLEQEDCIILRHGNFLFGFCERKEVDKGGVLTFFFEKKSEVDHVYKRLTSIATTEPKLNEKYRIYNFFAEDPEGRKIEFQYFDHPVDSYLSGDRLLSTRRSIRKYRDDQIEDDILKQVLEICRYAPTSMNTQSYYFRLIRDRAILSKLAETRGKSSSPIGNAPMAVAICSDPGLSKRHIQDGCIAAYHFLLSAWFYGLGTCWIAAMDREDVKQWLGIPGDHYVATVTPLGYPQHLEFNPPERKDVTWFLRE